MWLLQWVPLLCFHHRTHAVVAFAIDVLFFNFAPFLREPGTRCFVCIGDDASHMWYPTRKTWLLRPPMVCYFDELPIGFCMTQSAMHALLNKCFSISNMFLLHFCCWCCWRLCVVWWSWWFFSNLTICFYWCHFCCSRFYSKTCCCHTTSSARSFLTEISIAECFSLTWEPFAAAMSLPSCLKRVDFCNCSSVLNVIRVKGRIRPVCLF